MRSSNVDAAPKDYFKVHYFVLKLLGVPLDPIEDSATGFVYKIYMTFMFVVLYLYFPLGEIVSFAYNQNVEMATFSLAYTLTQSLGTIKIILILSIRKKIKAFCRSIESGPFSPDKNKGGNIEFLLIKKAITTSNMQGYFFHIFATLIVTQVVYYAVNSPGYEKSFIDPSTNTTLVKRVKMLPFNCKLPFEAIDSPYYEIGVAHGGFSAVLLGYNIGAIDAVICGMLCHIKAQLLILKQRLTSYIQRGIYLMKKDNPNLDQNEVEALKHISDNLLNLHEVPLILQKYICIAVLEIIIHHRQILKLSKDVDETFSFLMLVQFLFSLGILCFQLFQLSIIPIRSVYFVSAVTYTILMLFQIYLFCYFGNEVMFHSYEITSVIFKSSWFLTNLQTQKLLLIMMIRADRPIRMTAGKFVFLSLEAFMSILRGAVSYFMVLKNTNAPTSA